MYTSIDLSSEIPPFIDGWKNGIDDEVVSLSFHKQLSVSGQLLHFGAIYLCTFSALKGLNWLYSLFVLYSSSQPFLQICLISRYVLYIYNTNKQNFEAWSINFVLHVRSNIHLLSRIYNEIRTRKWVLEKLLTLNFFFKKKHISKILTSSSDRQNLKKMLKSYHMSWKRDFAFKLDPNCIQWRTGKWNSNCWSLRWNSKFNQHHLWFYHQSI